MLTKNGRKIITAFLPTGTNTAPDTTFATLGLINQKGEVCSGMCARDDVIVANCVGYRCSSLYDINNVSTSTASGISSVWYTLNMCVGTNAAEESEDDYTMTPIKIRTNSMWLNKTENGLTFGKIIQNPSTYNRDITIREVGIFLYPDSYVSGSFCENVLLYRKVLDTPIFIASGDSREIDLTLY